MRASWRDGADDDILLFTMETAQLPKTFGQYVRSFGPGLVVVLTWLGAGDIVDMGVAGGEYGYSLMWVLVLAVIMRFLFVSLIAKYQLCNQHGEGVLDGLARLHTWYAPALLVAAIVMGHFYGSYMTRGVGEACANMTGVGEVWHWAVACNVVALALVFRPAYNRVEAVFKVLLALLSISFVGTALWVGFNPAGVARGLISLEMPEQAGRFGPWLVAVAMIGAIGGSLMNLVYPYFLEAKGWRGPKFRRVQLYDFLLAMIVMIVLNLAIWTLGAELLHPRDLTIEGMDDLPKLLTEVLGRGGSVLFYLGIFAAVFTSLVGHALGLACLGSHAWLRWRSEDDKPVTDDYRQHKLYRFIVVWCLLSPLVWTAPGMPGFVTLTLIVNAAQVMLLPLIAGGLWCITALPRYIGAEHRNRWWENAVMLLLFGLALYGASKSVQSVGQSLQEMTEPDVSKWTPEFLGFSYIEPYTDPVTGFVVGGVNSTESIRQLTELNGIPIELLEAKMRPLKNEPGQYDPDPEWAGYRSNEGFLGEDERLLDIMAADNEYVVDELGLTHQDLARPLLLFAHCGHRLKEPLSSKRKQLGREEFEGRLLGRIAYLPFRFGDVRLKLGGAAYMGFQESPFRDGTRTNADVVIENVRTGKTLQYSELVPQMIERYGFYEGHGTSYRVDPRDIVEVLELDRRPR